MEKHGEGSGSVGQSVLEHDGDDEAFWKATKEGRDILAR
jgi:hypothetical protein